MARSSSPPVAASPRRRVAVSAALALAIFAINALINGPLFMTGEPPFRGSIAGGYAAMSRFLAQHPNPWGWDPYQYCGMPAQFLYLPGLPYLTAALTRLTGAPAVDVYRAVTAVLACLTPVTLFFFALHFTGSRRWALAGALAYTFFSPAYGLLPHLLKDFGAVRLPWRIQVLAKYGEGPHVSGLCLIPLALLAAWRAGTKHRYAHVLLAAILFAATVLVNWIAGLALAFACLLLLLTGWGSGKRTGFRALPVFAAAGLGYLLACFWLTPTFIRTIAFNWPADSFGYHFARPQMLLLAGLIATVLAVRAIFLRFPERHYFCLVTLAALVYGWVCAIFSRFGLDTIPESRRYALEFEAFLLLAVVEAFRLAWRNKDATVRLCTTSTAVIMLSLGIRQAWPYVTQGWTPWKPMPKEQTIEYRIASWLAAQKPEGRIFASGGLRYRLNAWFDLPQAGGVWESGLRNRIPLGVTEEIRRGQFSAPGQRREDLLLELKEMGVQYVVVHGPKSREHYRDFPHPAEFANALPRVWQEEDDAIYAMPAPALAHLLHPAELPPWHHPRKLLVYGAALDDTARPRLQATWEDAATLRIEGSVPPGMLIEVQVTDDSGWTAMQDGREIPRRTDMLGYIVLEAAPAAATTIRLHYRGTTEQRVMAGISAAAWIVAIAALYFTASSPGRRIRGAAHTCFARLCT